MKKGEFNKEVQEVLKELELKVNHDTATAISDGIFTLIKDLVKKEDKVPVGELGYFTQVERAARKGRNPSSGEELEIPAKVEPKFKPSKAFKNMFVE